MNRLFLVGLVVVLLVGVALFLLTKSQLVPPLSGPSPAPTPPTSEDIESLRAGGSSYRDPGGVFMFLYPNGYKLDLLDSGTQVRLTKVGPSQRGQTELYDGVLLVFELINLGGQSLSQWIDTSLKNATADGTVEVIEPKAPETVNGYSGFMYSVRSLGVSKYVVLQKTANSDVAVSITMAVNDPQNQGFQNEVDTILSTVEMLK